MLDEGEIKDAAGKTVDFRNTFIIATSNAGAERIREVVAAGETGPELKKQLIDYLLTERLFAPEFINRFDGVITFEPLTPDLLNQVANLLLAQVAKRIQEEKKITVLFDPGVAPILAKRGYDPAFGARPLRRVIQETVENFLAREILSGDIGSGSTITIRESDVA